MKKLFGLVGPFLILGVESLVVFFLSVGRSARGNHSTALISIRVRGQNEVDLSTPGTRYSLVT